MILMSDRELKTKRLLVRNVEKVIEADHLERALRRDKKLRVKFGIDPTAEKIHLGRAVVLWKLREFQELGHKIVLIIGDFTAQIGDPSDKLEKRPVLSELNVRQNMKAYLAQIGKILDVKKAEVRYNSEWLARLDFKEISELAENFTIQQMLERRNFRERFEKQTEISLREILYPLMQGYDSVAVKADVELGGTDQLFNLLAGRKIQERYGQDAQDVLITKMLIGTDGRKMSASWGNVINITDAPDDMFGKVMSLGDELMREYFVLCTDLEEDTIEGFERELTPRDRKVRLAREIVRRYYGEEAAHAAGDRFERVFAKKEAPEDAPALKLRGKKTTAIDLVLLSGVAKTKSEARRIIEQGGLKVNNEAEKNPLAVFDLKGGEAIKIGKRHFFKVE